MGLRVSCFPHHLDLNPQPGSWMLLTGEHQPELHEELRSLSVAPLVCRELDAVLSHETVRGHGVVLLGAAQHVLEVCQDNLQTVLHLTLRDRYVACCRFHQIGQKGCNQRYDMSPCWKEDGEVVELLRSRQLLGTSHPQPSLGFRVQSQAFGRV